MPDAMTGYTGFELMANDFLGRLSANDFLGSIGEASEDELRKALDLVVALTDRLGELRQQIEGQLGDI